MDPDTCYILNFYGLPAILAFCGACKVKSAEKMPVFYISLCSICLDTSLMCLLRMIIFGVSLKFINELALRGHILQTFLSQSDFIKAFVSVH